MKGAQADGTWAINIESFNLGNTTVANGTAIFSTTDKNIVLSSSSYTEWKKVIVNADSNIECESSYACISTKNCTDLEEIVPPLKLKVGKYEYTLPLPTWSYVSIVGTSEGCTLRVSESTQTNDDTHTITLGLAFLE